MWTRIKSWWRAEGAFVSLQGMDDRMLADMGLQREGLRDRVLGVETRDDGGRGNDGPRPLEEALRS